MIKFSLLQFVERLTGVYKQPFNFHKNPKLLVADNIYDTKKAVHCEPFSVRVGAICVTHTSLDWTVESMNKRYSHIKRFFTPS